MRSTHPLLERLGIEIPIIQAPMAGVSTPELAAAVSNAGALGSIAIGAGTLNQARDALNKTRAPAYQRIIIMFVFILERENN